MSSVSGQIQGRTVISKTQISKIEIIDIAMDRFCISSLDY